MIIKIQKRVLRGDAEVVLRARGNLSAASQYVGYLVHRRVHVVARVRAYDDEEDDEGRLDVAPVLVEGCEWDEDGVVARLPEEVPQRLHHADDAKGSALDFYLLAQRVFVGEERAHNVLSEHRDVLAPDEVGLGDEATTPDVLRDCVFVVGRDAEQNGRVGLLVCVAQV